MCCGGTQGSGSGSGSRACLGAAGISIAAGGLMSTSPPYMDEGAAAGARGWFMASFAGPTNPRSESRDAVCAAAVAAAAAAAATSASAAATFAASASA